MNPIKINILCALLFIGSYTVARRESDNKHQEEHNHQRTQTSRKKTEPKKKTISLKKDQRSREKGREIIKDFIKKAELIKDDMTSSHSKEGQTKKVAEIIDKAYRSYKKLYEFAQENYISSTDIKELDRHIDQLFKSKNIQNMTWPVDKKQKKSNKPS